MPCYDPPPTRSELAEWNFKKYGVRCTYEEMLKAIACEGMYFLEHEGIIDRCPEYMQRWYAEHKAQDAAKPTGGGT